MKTNKASIDPDFWQYARSFLHVYLPKVKNVSPHTIASYKQSMMGYVDYLATQQGVERQQVSFDDFSRKPVKAYLVWMHDEQHWAAKTCNLRLTALKSFMEYSADEDMTLMANYHEVQSVRGLKASTKAILSMTSEAMTALLKTPRTDTSKGRRNRMMFILLYDTAARAQELVDITLRDLHIVHVKTPFITLTGKGRKSRNVPLMDKTVGHLQRYLQEFHPDPAEVGDAPLFYSTRDGRPHALSTDALNLFLRHCADEARSLCPDIPDHVHCHLIRKTRAMTLYQQGMPLTVIMNLLGRADLSTTSNFYAFATTEMIHEAMKKTHPEAAAEVPIWKTEEFKKLQCTLE